ncbi:S41 family peptidase [Paenibacillus pinihumi]|uniref:S41 family peptidase n=1 Tax=Paenibacillus pinihumi TaxID=669462 RepID=UPI0003FFE8D9|nr:S41 family peptidase [Paenibacillus pinihumi]
MPHTSAARRQRIIVYMLIIAVLAGTAGFGAGQLWMKKRYPVLGEAAFDNLDRSYKEIVNNYMGDVDPESLIHGAVAGMVSSLNDPYSVYYTKEQGKSFLERYEDHFVGVGVVLRVDNGQFFIASTIEGAPAAGAGVLAEDRIVAIDGKSVAGKTLSDIITLTRGEEGTKVVLSLARASSPEPVDITVTRGEVPVTTVSSKMLGNGVGKIAISRFAESTAKEFEQAADSLQKQGMKGLLVDLRSNPGGLLQPAIEIASLLIPKDKVIVQVVYKNEQREFTHRSKQKKEWKLPVVVLIDENSASSSEVLSAALRANGAVLVGNKSFGKGIVQTFQQFADDSVLKLTEAQWRTPDGSWIHKEGVKPDIAVDMPEYANLPLLPAETTFKEGDYGKDVKTIQHMLNALGFGAITQEGVYNADTKEAVKRFQSEEQLEADGTVTEGTAYRLQQRLAAKIEQEDPQNKKAVEELRSLIQGKTP